MKKLKVLLCALMILSMWGCSRKNTPISFEQRMEPETEIQQQFDDFLLEEFKEAISEDTLSLHYTLVNPSTYGIELKEISLGTLGLDTIEEDNKEFYKTKEKLNSFDRRKLNPSQQNDYDLFKAYLELNESFIGLEYYGALFAPSSGLVNAIITNFSEYRFYDEQDIETYLFLLLDVPRYLTEAMEYTKKQVEMGLFMSDGAVEETADSIDRFVSKVENNELIKTFNLKLDSMDELDLNKKNELIKQNEAIVQDVLIPTVLSVKDELKKYMGKGMTAGYASLPHGKEYYEALIRLKLGYQGSMDELFEEGEEALEEYSKQMILLMMQDESIYDRYINSNQYFEEKTPVEILNQLEQLLLAEYPRGPEVSYNAEYLDPSVANLSTVAYYVIPPLDSITDNVIKINPSHAMDDLETLYLSLAHEGFPGHCYQNTYFYDTNPHPIRSILDFTGYSEGWAMKVELEALHWILKDDPELADFIAYDTSYGYLLQSLTDVGVNYYGWSKAELLQWLKEYGVVYGLDNEESADMLFQSVINDPGLIVPYGLGLMKMVELKEEAMQELRNKFDPIEYHRFLLEVGPMTYDLLEEKVEDWIDSQE